MKIRTYQPADRNECIAIFNSNTPLYFAPEELPDFEDWLNGQDENRLAYKTTEIEKYFVITDEEKVVGCGGFYIAVNEKRGNMVWGMVANALHKKGFGRKLLTHRIETIIDNYPNYIISIDTTQHSFQFFEKFGFKTTKITKDFYAKGLDRYDMVNGGIK